MSKKYLASIVVCTYNRSEYLKKCLESANNQSVERKKYEIVVVENSLDDQIFTENKEAFQNQTNKFLRSKPPGLSIARNTGWRNASSDIVVYLDDDAVPDYKWLENIISAYEKYSEAYAVGGRVIPLLEIEPPEWLTTEMFDYLSVVNYGEKTFILPEKKWLVGANVSFRRSFLENSGGFPEELGRIGNSNSLLSNDETPLFSKIRSLEKLVIYSGQASVRHLVPSDRLNKSWFRKRVIWQAISDVIQGDKLSSEQISIFKEQYIDLVKGESLIGRSIFGLYSNEGEAEVFPGKFADEIGFLYMCARYLVETGSEL